MNESRSRIRVEEPARWGGELQNFELRREDSTFNGTLAVVKTTSFAAIRRDAALILHPDEYDYFSHLSAERRQVSFLMGRYAAKSALRPHINNAAFAAINIRFGVFKNPIVCYPMLEPKEVAISHSDSIVVAIACPSIHPMALDIESIESERVRVMASQSLPQELDRCRQIGLDDASSHGVLWTAKESVSKVLRTGMTCPFDVFEIQSISHLGGGVVEGLFKKLAQYKFRAWIHGQTVLTIVLPKRTEIVFENGGPTLPKA